MKVSPKCGLLQAGVKSLREDLLYLLALVFFCQVGVGGGRAEALLWPRGDTFMLF